jgi:hypothetical protein
MTDRQACLVELQSHHPIRVLSRLASPARMGLMAVVTTLLASVLFSQTARSQSTPTAAPTDMDRAIALLTEARQHFQSVRDYECRVTTRERISGKLMPEGLLTMRVRNNPLCVYVRCENGPDKGLEACYVTGRNQGMMRVRPAGLVCILGFWSIDPRDPRALEKSRHCINEAGIGHLLDVTASYGEMERRLNTTQVQFMDGDIDGRAVIGIETIHPDRNAASFYGYRCVLWLDKATHLPLGADAYDWPRQGGQQGGDIFESYRYLNLRCNIGLGDDAFPG